MTAIDRNLIQKLERLPAQRLAEVADFVGTDAAQSPSRGRWSWAWGQVLSVALWTKVIARAGGKVD